MSSLLLTDVWRSVNALLATAAFLMIMRSLLVKWSHWTARMRLMAQAMLALLFVTVVSSVEQIIAPTSLGLREALTTAACAWIVFALIATHDDYSRR